MQIKLRKQIHCGFSSASSDDLFLEKMVELPIAPQKGMVIIDDDFEDSISCVQVFTNGRIEVWLSEDKTLYDEGLQHYKKQDISSGVWENRKKEYFIEQWQLYKKNGWKKQF